MEEIIINNDLSLYLRIGVIILILIILLVIFLKFFKSEYFKPFLKKLDTMIDENKDGIWSSQRLNLVITVFCSNSVIWLLYGGICFIRFEILDVPTNVIILYGVANGMAGTFKVFQKLIETKSFGSNESFEDDNY